ncbi:MAG TPA: VWA domain-containing protein [Candidatus Hydrogenedentes bacterium]|nr:VWA domain-containing protein [Candidatus Hydrogenedentota bacterium]HOL76419.1 VWA domain-containing protein [Candidatus Hydrogenedentota bacterium]HPO85457.1 VWA domain-containing protein [Candidatus Hydrogenedentota bacterium]
MKTPGKVTNGFFLVLVLGLTATAYGQLPASTSVEGFALKIFRVESGLYPFVQVYFRTFDQNMRPLVNLNEMNIGVMVKGRSYDPAKRQYLVQSIRNRDEAVRTVLVIDCSKSMAGKPFEDALVACARFLDSKRKQDQVAILAIRDTDTGYELVSNFERDKLALARRLADIKCDGNKTRLYDTIGAAMQMCGMVSQGGIQSTDAEYIISNSIVVLSDGKDEGSALSREELNNRITALKIPIPIYSIAYSKVSPEYFKNLEALSKNSFGVYYLVGETTERMQRVVEDIQNILQNDYVVVFRSYVPVDGGTHALKIGLEYPSRSGKMMYQSAEFEAIEPPPVDVILQHQAVFDKYLKKLPDGNPYMKNPHVSSEQPAAPAVSAEKTQ